MKIKYKIIALIILICLSLFVFNTTANATSEYQNSYDYDKVEKVVDNFIYYLDTGNSNIYYIIDDTNTNLYQGILDYLYSDIEIEYDVKKIEKIDENTYKVKGKISASDENWNINGFSVYFELEKNYESYKIVQTDLFNKIGAENIAKTVFNLVGIIFLAIILIILFFIIIATMIIIIIVVANKKKQRQEK